MNMRLKYTKKNGEAENNMAKEIEKKYLIKSVPSDIQLEGTKEINQTYLATGTEELRVRKIIKKQQETHTMTIKKGSGLTREEKEFEIHVETYNQMLSNENRTSYLTAGKGEVSLKKIETEQQETYVMTFKASNDLTQEKIEFEIDVETYEQLVSNVERKPLIKTRSAIHVDSFEFDYDVYQNNELLGLQTIEVEFPSEEDAHAFEQPTWFGKDVTGDKRYKNQNLWKEIQ